MKFVSAATAILGAAAQRSTVSFDLGWRTHLGADFNTSGSVCQLNYPYNLTGLACDGLIRSVSGSLSAEACQLAACTINADVYQWCPGSGAPCGNQSCLIGPVGNCVSKNGAGWISFSKNGTNQAWNPPAAQVQYDDSTWDIVDLPHDFEITGTYSSGANKGEAFLPYNQSFYRKHFSLPSSWNQSYIEVHVEGALSTSSWWINGVQVLNGHTAGYIPIIVRLDNVTGANLQFGPGSTNVLVAFIDGAETTGWWYEGAGLTRKAYISASSNAGRVVTHGLTAPAYVDGAIHDRATPADGVWADSAIVTPTAEVIATGNVRLNFTILAPDGVTVMGYSNVSAGGNKDGEVVKATPIALTNPELWSIPRPYLYTLQVTVGTCPKWPDCEGTVALDTVNITFGIRAVTWDPDMGLFINEQPVKMRGFCNHESFAGTGGVIPDRVDLLRVQQMRGLGGNAWRTSHNPPEPILLDITDRLGIAVLDENRVFATSTNCEGCADVPEYSGSPVQDMIAFVRRDRTHASVVWWSFCNEAGCGNGAAEPALDFRLATYANDGSRYVGANMGWISPVSPTNMSALLDVMGFSHADHSEILSFHEQEPMKPLVMTECCSCETQRGEDEDMRKAWNSSVFYGNENSACVASQTQTSNGYPWMAGTFVWTLHDYFGEPDNWPHISSSFGSYDLAGFPKAPVWWYRSWWLANISATDAGRPPLPNTSTFVHLVESWQAPVSPATTRNLTAYTNAPFVALVVNGQALGQPVPVPPYGAAFFTGVPYAPGTIVAQAQDGTGNVLASDTKKSWGPAAGLVLAVDAPNPVSGTGSAVYLDGHDVALIRATIVDAAGNVVANGGDVNVTFSVASGPAYIMGVGNGNPASQEPNHVAYRTTYHGLVRAVVRVLVDASGSDADRATQAFINVDAGRSAASATVLQGPASAAPTSITINAFVPGIPSASITIPLSVDPKDSVLEVAAASVGVAYTGA